MSDRKYRHRGYQDDDRDRDERRPARPVGPRKERTDGAPRGRGVGTPTEVAFKCSVCGHEVKTLTRIEDDSVCPSCGKPLHTCTNCSFFDSAARFECRKPIPARVESKAKANDCDLYRPKAIRDLRSKTPKSPGDARSAFDALFKK